MKTLGDKRLLYIAMCGMLNSALAGCNGDTQSSIEPKLNENSAACTIEGMDLLSGLDANETFDSITLYHRGVQAPYTTAAGGKACAQAMSVDQCNQALDTARSALTSNAVITTQGDRVLVYSTPQELQVALGEINNEQKALLWMHINEMDVKCTGSASPISPIDNEAAWFGTYTELTNDCAPITHDRINIRIDYDGTITQLERYLESKLNGACIGRTPPGQLFIEESLPSPYLKNEVYIALGALFGQHAAYEAASVVAFKHLRQELDLYNAPETLLQQIDTAANDEVRHAKQVGNLANRFGAKANKYSVAPCKIRDLEAIALDNLKEGCIGETWGALMGLYQAEHAKAAEIRQTMKAIAVDEVGHAALSWQIHAWLCTQLDEKAQAHLNAKKQEAILLLKSKIDHTYIQEHQRIAGTPPVKVQQALLKQLQQKAFGSHRLAS